MQHLAQSHLSHKHSGKELATCISPKFSSLLEWIIARQEVVPTLQTGQIFAGSTVMSLSHFTSKIAERITELSFGSYFYCIPKILLLSSGICSLPVSHLGWNNWRFPESSSLNAVPFSFPTVLDFWGQDKALLIVAMRLYSCQELCLDVTWEKLDRWILLITTDSRVSHPFCGSTDDISVWPLQESLFKKN